jgi:hypothetical protein
MPMGSSMGAGLRPFLTGYSQAGLTSDQTTSACYAGTQLTIPIDGRVYDFDFPPNDISIAFGPITPAGICSDTVLNLKQRASSTCYAITSWPTAKWQGNVVQTMPQTNSARMKVIISVSPSGIYDVSAMWMGV